MTASENGARAPARTLVGATAEGATAAGDPPPAPPPPGHSDRGYRLRADETVAAGLRRAARGQLDDSADALARASGRDELGEAVHGTRKALKRVRTTLRLSRDALRADAYEREKERLKTIADRLAGARDALVMVQTLAALEKRAGDAPWTRATGGLRARLEADHEHAAARLAEDGDDAVAAREALEEQRVRTAQWQFAHEDFAAVEPGLRRIYRQGRRRMRAAREDPAAEHLHEARKRVKDLWHAAQLLRAAHPKRMKRLARDAHALSDVLGDHHDLTVLREYVARNPSAVADMKSHEALVAAIDDRCGTLCKRALKLGRRLYKRAPRRFVDEVARGWDKRVASAQRSPAG